MRCHYLTVKCLIEAKELNEALEVLNGAEFDLNSFNAKHSDDSFMSNENCVSIYIYIILILKMQVYYFFFLVKSFFAFSSRESQ